MGTKGKWTTLTYIAAHNNLDHYGTRSANQILGVGSDANVRHGVLLDLASGATRFAAALAGHKEYEEHLSEFDSGDPARLIETAKWMFAKYPAEHYALILWSHGAGWQPHEIRSVAEKVHGPEALDTDEDRALVPGSRVLFRTSLAGMLAPESSAERAILFDDGTGHALDTLQLGNVVRELSRFVGQKLDLIGMDACLMGSIEIAHQLRNDAAYMVASEELVPLDSWPYDSIFKQLKLAPDITAPVLADIIVERYITYYTHHEPPFNGGDVTKIALDLSKTDVFVAAMRTLSQALIETMPEALACMEQAQTATYFEETCNEARVNNKFGYHLWDIISMARHLSENCVIDTVKNAVGKVLQSFTDSELVVRSDHRGEWFDHIGGLSAYWIPPKKEQARHVAKAYAEVDFAQDASWHAMLKAYRYPDWSRNDLGGYDATRGFCHHDDGCA
ncbi:MAG: hypothetical protein JXA89_27590 [Anaerolineae bacterium]|nr:hypothetical protein [Anaerolineae bacterium]